MTTKKQEGTMGAAILTGIAAAAGTYFLYGASRAKAHRKQVKSWMLKAKAEVLEQLEKMDVIDEAKYHKAVDKVANKYRTLKNVDKNEVEETIADLKKHWKNMVKPAPKRKKKKVTKK